VGESAPRHGRGARRGARGPGKRRPRAATPCLSFHAEPPPGLGTGWRASTFHFFFKAAAAPHGDVAAGSWRKGRGRAGGRACCGSASRASASARAWALKASVVGGASRSGAKGGRAQRGAQRKGGARDEGGTRAGGCALGRRAANVHGEHVSGIAASGAGAVPQQTCAAYRDDGISRGRGAPRPELVATGTQASLVGLRSLSRLHYPPGPRSGRCRSLVKFLRTEDARLAARENRGQLSAQAG